MPARRRLTSAERLQQRFERVQLSPPTDHPRSEPEAVRDSKLAASIMAVFFATLLLIAGVPIGLNAAWWGTRSTEVCTVSSVQFHDTRYRGRVGVDDTVHTEGCGTLRVVSGGILDRASARMLSESIDDGGEYRLDIRGWDQPFGPRAIVAAERAASPGSR